MWGRVRRVRSRPAKRRRRRRPPTWSRCASRSTASLVQNYLLLRIDRRAGAAARGDGRDIRPFAEADAQSLQRRGRRQVRRRAGRGAGAQHPGAARGPRACSARSSSMPSPCSSASRRRRSRSRPSVVDSRSCPRRAGRTAFGAARAPSRHRQRRAPRRRRQRTHRRGAGGVLSVAQPVGERRALEHHVPRAAARPDAVLGIGRRWRCRSCSTPASARRSPIRRAPRSMPRSPSIGRRCSPAFRRSKTISPTLRILEEEAKLQADAVAAARESVKLTENRYKAGTASFLDVIVVQNDRAEQRAHRSGHPRPPTGRRQRAARESARRRLGCACAG